MGHHHTGSLENALEALETSENGLAESEVASRLERFGRNELQATKEKPEIIKFLLQFKNFFALLLIFGGMLGHDS